MALTHSASHWAVAHGHTKKKPTARPPQGPPSQPRDPNRGFQRLKHEHSAHSSPRPGTPIPRLHSRPCPAVLRIKGPQWDRGPLTAPHLCAPSVPFLSAPCLNHAQSCLHPSSSHPASVCHRGPTASSEQEGAATQQALGKCPTVGVCERRRGGAAVRGSSCEQLLLWLGRSWGQPELGPERDGTQDLDGVAGGVAGKGGGAGLCGAKLSGGGGWDGAGRG